jgi:predicted anti-sigma-YlaC factor YlaD
MTEIPTCTDMLIAAMAIRDGEQPLVPVEAVEEHLAGCPACRAESEGLAATSRLFDTCRRAGVETDLWPALEPRVAAAPSRAGRQAVWVPFIALAVVLVGSRVLLALTTEGALAIKLLVVALAVAAFVYARENPFTIRTEFTLRQE